MSLTEYMNYFARAAGLGYRIAKVEFKLRNEGSYLGIFWYLLNPVLTFILLLAIFDSRLGAGIPSYPLYMLLGVIMFNFFQASTAEATRSIIRENHYLIKSINFPREALIAAIVLKNVFSHVLEIALFVLVAFFSGIKPLLLLYYLPVVFLLAVFIFGASLILSSLTVYFVDLGNIWDFALKLIWLATPIFYAIGGQARLMYANLANPMYYYITLARELVVYGRLPEAWLVTGAFFWALLFFAAGLLVFGKLKNKFAELV